MAYTCNVHVDRLYGLCSMASVVAKHLLSLSNNKYALRNITLTSVNKFHKLYSSELSVG